MNAQLDKQAIEITKHIMHVYYGSKDLEKVLSFFTKDAVWIGPGEEEVKYSYCEIEDYFQKRRQHIRHYDIVTESLSVMECGETCSMVFGTALIRSRVSAGEVNLRISVLFKLIDEELKVAQVHLSGPHAEIYEEECILGDVDAQSYRHLQKMLQEKTEVINMITNNIDGGLKGSNDDDTFSYFYVNEGLPNMLGYTYEEFMKKSGGSAVGAVYPKDLDSALKDCAECFEEGPVYSTEYRMEKKDGSLIWVLDTGRKVLDSEGITRINSIIMDITPLKNAQFELEIERERYRIALDNIKDVMYEYDIEQDLYVTFSQTVHDGQKKLNKFEIPNFLQEIENQGLVHPKDAETLINVLQGKMRSTVEIRMKSNLHAKGWRWNRLRCSVICDNLQKPIKTIGMIKDITDKIEKETELIEQANRDGLTHLLNQRSIKPAVQQQLDSLKGGRPDAAGMLLMDLDNFKLVNDTMGHLFGNDVLIEAARVLQENSSDNDIAGRIGGDEFLLFLKDSSRELVAECAEHIIRDVSQICVNDKVEISCSIGIAMYSGLPTEFNDLFQAADDLLYKAKRNGKKCWEISSKV